MKYKDLRTWDAKWRAINWYRDEWDIWNECECLGDVLYSLLEGDLEFTEDGEYIE